MRVFKRIRSVAGSAKRRIRRGPLRREIMRNTRHLHGPERVELGDSEVMVTLLARDVAWFLPVFLDHHFALGVSHILVIDNGSKDQTVEICRGYQHVTVMQNLMPTRVHQSAMRSDLSQFVATGGWILFADADELIEMPLPVNNALRRLTDYCNRYGYSAVLAQMLDRFSINPYSESRDLSYSDAISQMSWYSLNDLEFIDYDSPQISDRFGWHVRGARCADPAIRFQQGGIRAELLGEVSFMTKHALVQNQRVRPLQTHPHFVPGANVADVTFLINHFKLSGDWISRDKIAQREARYQYGGDARRLAAIRGDFDTFRLCPVEPRSWLGVEKLLDEGFLYASLRFRAEMGQPPSEDGG